MGSEPRYGVGDFDYENYEGLWFECPYLRCNETIHPGPYDSLGDIMNAAEAHLKEKHSD